MVTELRVIKLAIATVAKDAANLNLPVQAVNNARTAKQSIRIAPKEPSRKSKIPVAVITWPNSVKIKTVNNIPSTTRIFPKMGSLLKRPRQFFLIFLKKFWIWDLYNKRGIKIRSTLLIKPEPQEYFLGAFF